MSDLVQTRIVSVAVECGPATVVAFITNPLNLPKWAKSFCKAVSKRGDEWLVDTGQGSVTIRFAPPNPYGVTDHHVVLPTGQEVYVPMRVIANGSGSDVHFTLFRLPGMSDRQFADDAAMVEKDLQTLKQLIVAQAEHERLA